MTMTTTRNNRIFFGLIGGTVAVVMAFGAFAQPASAQVYYPTYGTQRSQEETIAYLQAIVNQLLAELSARGGTSYQYQYQNQYSYPYGRVLGDSISFPQYQYGYQIGDATVDVGTAFLGTDDDDIEFNGIIDLNNASYANVWFEYDTDDRDYDETTRKLRVTRDGKFSISIDKDDLDENEWYHYRAVAESPSGRRDYGGERFFYVSDANGDDDDDDDDDDDNEDEPDAQTESADDVDENSAELNGDVDMNDFNNGHVFFVYGQDEDQIEDVEDEFDSYSDVDEDGDDLQKVSVDSDLDDDDSYSHTITGLDDDTEYFFQICVEYEDEDDDDTITCGGVEDFETDSD